ncbi:MAG: TolC family protein, partial [Methylococcaceae bacterium]
MNRLCKTVLWLILLPLTGCMVGPDYRKPQTELPKTWSTPVITGSPNAKQVEIGSWWHIFNDPILAQLVKTAEAGNLDLYQAEARVREARARRHLASAELMPTLSMSMSGSRTETSSAVKGVNTELYSHALDAGWELDIFGKKRRGIEAADATEQAAQEDLRDVLVSLCAEVALNYVDVRGYQARLKITEDNLAAQTETYDIT